MSEPTPPYLLLWDGECGLCAAAVTWVQTRDRKKAFQPTAIQRCPSPPMTPEIMERCQYEMALVTPTGEVLFGAKGMLRTLEVLKWGIFARILAIPPLVWPIQLGYWLIARNRLWISKRFFGTTCRVDGNRK